MNTLNLELNIEETNLILEALGELPFVKVHGLITKIQQQASSQLNSEGKAKDETATP